MPKTRKLHKITNCCSILDIAILHYWYLTGAKWILVLYTVISLLRVIIMITCRLAFQKQFPHSFYFSVFSEHQEDSYEIVVYISFFDSHTTHCKYGGYLLWTFSILNDVLDSLNLVTFTDIKDIQRLWIINVIIKIINIFTIT